VATYQDGNGVVALYAQLDQFWRRAMANYKRLVEQSTEEDKMTTKAEQALVRTEVVVEAPQDRAFRVFTERFDKIKPREHNMLAVDIDESVLEPRAGGRVYDRGVDGSECQWGRVLAYDPPERIVFTWDISPRWQIESDLEKASEVEIRFIAEAPGRTRVELEHRHLDRHGEGWNGLREGVANEQGWPLYLGRYAEQVAETS
jgi:uncharacterized protein YndB with AHSA1/START domain